MTPIEITTILTFGAGLLIGVLGGAGVMCLLFIARGGEGEAK